MKLETIAKGEYCRHDGRGEYVIKDSKNWKQLQDKTFVEYVFGQPKALPVVDFTKEMVLAVYRGKQSSGGYGITIVNVLEEATQLSVLVQETDPGIGDIVTDALTQPYHCVKVPKSEKEVKFVYYADGHLPRGGLIVGPPEHSPDNGLEDFPKIGKKKPVRGDDGFVDRNNRGNKK